MRIALGASSSDVLRDVMRRAVLLTVLGVAAGVAVALAASRVLAGWLYGIDPDDPATYALTASGLTAVALLASWLPARRAMRINPIDALRE